MNTAVAGLDSRNCIFTVDTIRDIIENEIYSVIGVPEIPPQIQLTQVDMITGLTAYYAAIPIVNAVNKQFVFNTAQLIDLNLAKPNPNADEWFFIGIVGEGRKFNFTSNLLDVRLTGIPLSFMYIDPMQYQYNSTAIDQNIGKPEYFVNLIDQTIQIIEGGDVGLSVRLGWGSTNLGRIRPAHYKGVAKLISVPYYERLISLRGQVEFKDTNYKMNMKYLEDKLSQNKEENVTFLKSIRKFVILKG